MPDSTERAVSAVVTTMSGRTIEVLNTDAEGRIVLSDALHFARTEYTPEAIIDLATLTGACVIALGKWASGVMGNNDALVERLRVAGEATGERVWPLPLWDDHRDFMRSKHADIWNSGPKRDGHPIQGAAFLSYFVDEDLPWAHIDIAGVSAVESAQALFVPGPTGFGVRLLTEVAASYA